MDSRGPFKNVVFGLLFICMTVTLAFGVMTLIVPGVREAFRGLLGFIIMIVAGILLMIVLYVIFCSACGRKMPCNLICLFCVVVCECCIVGVITANYSMVEVLISLGVTTVIVFICFLLAFTPLDFTKCYMFLVIAGAVLLVFSTIVMVMIFVFGFELTLTQLVLCCLFTLYHSLSLVMTIQMVLGGKSIELEEDDYVTGTVMLYMSIILIFLDILQMLGLFDALGLFD